MGHTNNREPRRLWKSMGSNRARVPCAACGATARPCAAHVPFCQACLDLARHSALPDWDDLNATD